MIWEASASYAADAAGVRESLYRGWAQLLGSRVQTPGLLKDVCAAVATAWESELGGRPVPPSALGLMGSRSFWLAGEPDAARELVRSVSDAPGRSEHWMTLIENGGPSLAACLCLGGGLLRPSTSSLSVSSPVWVMDVGRLTTARGELAELGLPSRMRRVLAATAEIWDAESGRGMLILSPGGAPEDGPIHAYLRSSAPKICRVTLEELSRNRGWEQCPEVHRDGVA